MTPAPRQLRDPSGRIVFAERADLWAVRQDTGDPVEPGALAVVPDEAGAVFVVYERRRAAMGRGAGPVYEAGAGGPLAVPTGRIFVRLAEGRRATEARAAFTGAGFVIERTLPYAPHAAWLRPDGSGIAAALTALAALRRLPDVVHVEPQMLLERTAKHT
jgi:hypothetical protein